MINKKESREKNLVVASSNPGKIKEFNNFLSTFQFNIISQPEKVCIEETGNTFLENARLKALGVSKLTGEWTIADDSGLCINALGGAPGILSARYASTDQERIDRVLKELEHSKDRSAYFCAAICLGGPDGEILLEVEGICNGVIVKVPRGNFGFGYDPIFEVEGTNLTFAQMEASQKRAMGHRGKAFSLIEPLLRNVIS